MTGVTAKDREYDGTSAVELSGGELVGVVAGDESRLSFDLGSGVMSDAHAGENKRVTTSVLLTGAAASNYTLTQPSVTVNISPQTGLSLQSHQLSAAYIGMQMSDVTVTCNVTDKSGMPVAGSARWKITMDKVSEHNVKTLVFVPNSSDYAQTEFEVEFDGEYLTLTFDISSLSEKLTTQLEYGQDYSPKAVRLMFNDLYLDFVSAHPEYDGVLADQTPVLDGQTINEYDKWLYGVDSGVTIPVGFTQKKYTVTFDAKNDTSVTTEQYYYGNYVKQPTEPQNNGNEFLGWYYMKTMSDDTQQETEWDFQMDRVTGDLTLYALWRNVDYELDSLEAVLNATDKNALEKLEEGDVTVTALYKSSDGAYEQRVPLDWADLKLTYSSGNELHAAQPNVVTIEYGGKSVQVTVTARPLKADTSGLRFEDKTVTAEEGVKQTLAVSGSYPSQIDRNGTTYTYSMAGVVVGTDGVTDVGEYVVTAHFRVTNSDYYADDMTATLNVIYGDVSLTVAWSDETLYYDGKAQLPEVTLTDENGADLTDSLDLTFSVSGGDGKGIAAGTYVVTVTVNTPGYVIDGGHEPYLHHKQSPRDRGVERQRVHLHGQRAGSRADVHVGRYAHGPSTSSSAWARRPCPKRSTPAPTPRPPITTRITTRSFRATRP